MFRAAMEAQTPTPKKVESVSRTPVFVPSPFASSSKPKFRLRPDLLACLSDSSSEEGMGEPEGSKSAPEPTEDEEKGTEVPGKRRRVAEPQQDKEAEGASNEDDEVEEPPVSCETAVEEPPVSHKSATLVQECLFHQSDPSKGFSVGGAETSFEALATLLDTLKCHPQEALGKLGWEMVSTSVNPEVCPMKVAIVSLRTLLGGTVSIDETFSCKLLAEIRKGSKGNTIDIAMKAKDRIAGSTWHAGSWVSRVDDNGCVALWSLVPKAIAYMAVMAVVKHCQVTNREEIDFLLRCAKENGS